MVFTCSGRKPAEGDGNMTDADLPDLQLRDGSIGAPEARKDAWKLNIKQRVSSFLESCNIHVHFVHI